MKGIHHMKRSTALALAGLLVGLTLPAVAATAWADDNCHTYITQVTGRPDSGSHGNWATDTFKRTTFVCDNSDGTFTMKLTDSGEFTTTAAAKSPGTGVTLPDEPISGSFSGGAVVTVTSATGPHDPGADSDGAVSSSDWHTLVFDDATAKLTSWGWRYSTGCETWFNTAANNSGDITKVCEAEEPPTTTVPPTTTTPPPPSSSAPPTSSTGSIPPTTDKPSASSTSSKAAPVHYADSANSKTDSGDLAYTGTSASLLWVVLGAVVLLGGGGTLLYLTRRRRTTGEHRR